MQTPPPSQQPTQLVNANAAPVLHGVHNNKEIPSTTITLLKTAIAPVIGEGIRIQGNILFDEGSQRSFITVETAAKLKLKPVTTENVTIAPFGAEYSSPNPHQWDKSRWKLQLETRCLYLSLQCHLLQHHSRTLYRLPLRAFLTCVD